MSESQYSPDNAVPGEPLEVALPGSSMLYRVFKGPDGVRSGWRIFVYLLLAVVVALALLFILQSWQAHGAAVLWLQATQEACLLAAAIVPAFIMTRIEKRPFADYGLPLRDIFGRQFWVGCVWGILAITLLLVMIRGFHGFYFGHIALHGIRVLKFAAFWGLFFLLVGLFEEFLLRGYLQFTLTNAAGFWPAAFMTSAAFGALHTGNSGEAWIGILSAALIGLFFCLTLRRTGTLWFAVGFHQAFDWGETFLYSVPNSGTTEPGHLLNSSFHGPIWLTGGSVGPEGSVFVFLLIVILWVVFDRVYPQIRYPAPPRPAFIPEPAASPNPLGIAG